MPDAPDTTTGFAALGLRSELLDSLAELGYEEPTPIQTAAIPVLLTGQDLLGQAATGTGKTAAFALPLLQRLAPGDRSGGRPGALVLVPTRELAMQTSEAVHRYGRRLPASVLPVYGGQPIARQLRALGAGVDVVVATPGRAADHLARGTLHLERASTIVLDEADEMLDLGFADDLEAILASTPADRQTVLFSATLPRRIDAIAQRHLRDPARVRIADESATGGDVGLVRHVAYLVSRAHKPAALGRVLDVEAPAAALVFCRTREVVDSLTETLNGRGYRAEALHGGMAQEARDRVMGRLRAGTADLLVATDVAARGLDVDVLTHVVNYDVPSSVEAYVHRAGRVGRAGREGVAVTLAEPREHRLLEAVGRATGRKIRVESMPTVADLQARRLELTAAALREAAEGGDLDRYRPVVEPLTEELDLMEVALAAVKLAHAAGTDARGGKDDQEIPEVARNTITRNNFASDTGTQDRYARPTGRRGAGSRAEDGAGRTRLWVSLGREAGVRPQDLVGAITGETRLSGRDIGAIDVSTRFSLVEVPDAAADEVISAMRNSSIRGRRVTIRRDRA